MIDVDGVHAEDWSGDSHNEDLLYGSVTITPYVFGTGVGAGATVADWLTVGYGKDSEGNFNSTHILVTAEDNAGSERKALVYCEYIAPDGYEFDGGAKSVYKQFIVTQKEGLSVVASLSNVYAETIPAAGATITAATLALTVNGDAPADVAAALSTYGITVTADKGATASVASDGTVTLTVPENKYKNGGITYTLSVKSSSSTLLASATFTQAEGSEEGTVTCQYTYDLEIVNSNGFGFPANQTGHQGNYAFIRNVKKDGNLVTLTQEIADEVLAFAYRGVAPTDEEKASKGQSAKVSSATAVQPYVRWFGGTQIDIALNTGASGQITKIVAYNPDGTEFGSFMVWID